jgi:two-component system, NtrC family, response regulator AtoC
MSKEAEINNGKAFRAQEPLLDKDKLLKSIFRISTLLTAPSRLDEILAKILDEVVDTIGFDRGIIRLFDESRQYLETKVVKNYNSEEEKRAFLIFLNVNEHDCLATKVAKSGQHIAIENAATDNRITETDRMLTKIFYRGSIFCAPLKIGEDVIGILTAWRKEEKKFFPEEVNLFLTFASQISIIIHNTRLFETNAEKIRQLMVLQEAVSAMNGSYALDNSIREVLVKSALDISRADKVLVFFWDLIKKQCLVNDGKKLIKDDKNAFNEKILKGIIGKSMDTNAVVLQQPGSDSSAPPLFNAYPYEIVMPLNIKDRYKGALYMAKKEGTYTQDQINLLDILVKNAATSYDNAIMHSVLFQEARSLKTEVEKLKEREDMLLGFHNIRGKSKAMVAIFHLIGEVASHNTNMLIQGESGTGKELIARAIHRQGSRSAKPFVDVNCAAIPGTLLESELFGYEAGAFTDARKRKIGLLEYANGGTMLLDEIGDMNIQLQAKFLRMLEDGYIRRLGGIDNIPIDVRFVFSTNKDLNKMVADGSFREDLFYRISVVPIHIPPLRERPDDIILLAQHFVEEFNKKFSKRVKIFSKDAEQELMAYAWPGNVRELKNIIERVMILQTLGDVITKDHLPSEIKATADKNNVEIPIESLLPRFIEKGMNYGSVTEKIATDLKGKLLSDALALSKGNKTEAARRLGISRYKLIREQKKINKNINVL